MFHFSLIFFFTKSTDVFNDLFNDAFYEKNTLFINIIPLWQQKCHLTLSESFNARFNYLINQ